MISSAIERIRGQILQACNKSGRSPDEITLVAVTKNRSLAEIKEVVSCGIYNIGENRVQEAVKKICWAKEQLPGFRNIRWHMIGHLQTNKVKEAVENFDLIQSVDSLKLAERIELAASKINKVQDILIQVRTSLEPTKTGVQPYMVSDLLKEISRLKYIRIRGLMTIAPLVKQAEEARPYFRELRMLREELSTDKDLGVRLEILSMGMTNDFWVAIEEGATMIRLGRAIFEG